MEVVKVEYPDCKIVQSVLEKHVRRAAQGQKQYGQSMDEHPMGLLQSLREAQEEALDMVIYLEKAINRVLELMQEGKISDEINRLREVENLFLKHLKTCEGEWRAVGEK